MGAWPRVRELSGAAVNRETMFQASSISNHLRPGGAWSGSVAHEEVQTRRRQANPKA